MAKRFQVEIKVIPHKTHRYETVGDYFVDPKGKRQIRVSDMGNADFEFMVALHEFIEQHLCLKRGIPEEKITAFDIEFEKNRAEGNEDEPGDDPKAPYFKEHQLATKIEKEICAELGINWDEYDQAIAKL